MNLLSANLTDVMTNMFAVSSNNWAAFKWLYIPITIWIVLVIVLMILLLRKYTFGNWTLQHPNPYQKETMGLPRGVMRGLLTLTLLVVVVLLELFTIFHENFETRISEFMVAFQMMLSFYFGSKVMHHLTSVDERKNKESAQAFEGAEQARSMAMVNSGDNVSNSKPDKDFDDEKAVG